MSGTPVDFARFSYRYPGAPAPSLRDVDLRVWDGEFVVLAGRSAAGKSTLLQGCVRARPPLPRRRGSRLRVRLRP